MRMLWYKQIACARKRALTKLDRLPPAIQHIISPMANKKPTEPTKRRNNVLLSAAKNTQARQAAVLQKKAAVSHARGRGQKVVMDTNDENDHSTPPKRRSSRLNGPASDRASMAPRTNSCANAKPSQAKRKSTGAKANANQGGSESRHDSPFLPRDDSATPSEDAQSDARSGLDEIQDLRWQLQQEKGFRLATP
jgi:hypothetical protein